MQNIWFDRAVTALITLLLGAGAQGLLSWREIAVLSREVATQRKTDEVLISRIAEVAQTNHDTAVLIAKLEQRIMFNEHEIEEHRDWKKGHHQ